MPAVSHLDRIWCAVSYTAGIFGRPVTRDDLNTRMLLKPHGNRFGCPLRQQIHGAMCLAIYKDSAIHSTMAQCEIVYPKHAWCRAHQRWGTMDKPQDCGGTGRHRRALTLPRSGFSTHGQTEVL